VRVYLDHNKIYLYYFAGVDIACFVAQVRTRNKNKNNNKTKIKIKQKKIISRQDNPRQ